MILVDTSVWVDHARRGVDALAEALARREILCHPFVIGELALGGFARTLLEHIGELPKAVVGTDEEVLSLIEQKRFAGRGIGYVDAHLLASAKLMGDARIWTRDRSLQALANDLGLLAAV